MLIWYYLVALSVGKSLQLDRGGRPQLLNKGMAVYFQNNQWQTFCLNNEMKIFSEALKICRKLGFRYFFKYVAVYIRLL